MSNNGFAIPIFLSHSINDKQIAGKIKKKLDHFGVDIFLAHEDIEGGTDWKPKLYSEIKNCEIFIVLLSKNYHEANFTDQELGMALAYEKPVIPISIDGTMPYGFMEKYQCMKCDPEITNENIEKLMGLVMNFSDTGKEFIDLLIEKLSNAGSFEDATFWSRKLVSYSKFTKSQINNIAEAYIKNNQIYGSFMASPNIKNILKNNQKQIKSDFKKYIKF